MNEGWNPGSREESRSDRTRVVLQGASLGLACLAAGWMGAWLLPGPLPLVSPAAGVALAGLLLLGVAFWPVVGVAAAAVELLQGSAPAFALVSGGGAALGAALAALLLRGARFHPRLDRVRDVLALAVLGAAASASASTLVSAAAMAMFDDPGTPTLGAVALARWLSEVTGILVVAPFLFALASDPAREDLPRAWPVEAVVGGALALFLGVALFGGRVPANLAGAALLLPLPLVLWGAFRLGLAGASGAVALLVLVGAWRTAGGTGPFADGALGGGSAAFWVYAITLAVAGLLLRALIAESRGTLKLLQGIFESSSEGILVIVGGRVVRGNSAAGHLFGTRGRERFVGVSLGELSPPAQPDGTPSPIAFERHLREADSAGGGHRFAWVWQRLDGSPLHAEVALSPLLVEGEAGHLAVVRDVTAQRAQQAILQRAREEADQANVSKTQYLGRVSHDIRSALTSNLGFSRLMTRDESLPARARDHAERIQRSGLNILQLVNDILETARVEVGRLAVSASSFELAALLQELSGTFRPRAQAKGLVLTLRTDGGLPEFVRGDLGKIRQVLTNLLGNALKFTPEGKVSLEVGGRTDPDRRQGWWLVFTVSDTGPGMSAEDMERVFGTTGGEEPLRVSSVLGLPGSLELARVMGGSLSATSREGQGARLVLEVPVEASEELAAGESATRRVVGLAPGEEDRRILVVDDREENRTLLSALLGRVGFQVKEAADGSEAIQAFAAWMPHLLLMNRQMPVMDGTEATRRIKVTERGKRTPIIMVTAGGFEDDSEEMLSAGADGIVRLPFSEAEVLREIERHLRVRWVYEESSDS